ncbi:DegT/DnrJ/EryC1/StrS aminotransferase family protein [Ferrovibrio sp.]|uniref:DegT/DnrJ/EryC1/StrS family aminotransferase n=1 Tax=Ferrovibrio sp. TaxID=1917215 RepID=UPI000CB8F6F1|nr:DegT/DnrJ/EryC1/StrS family aminotransferase [Ferrovibrio sp.]PJI41915.1 MAG: pyridoxal-5'-phosphate-dependent protein [Ferrovibrio sp.]
MMEIYMSGPWITEHEEKVVLDAVRNGWYGEKAYWYVETFEREFAAWHGRKYALMTPNCTSAIHLLLAALGIGPGDEVIVPECTWIASAAPITYQRAKTVFADIDPEHWCLTPETIAARITPQTKAVIVVDLYGNMPDWDGITKLCAERGIVAIEDSAEALGSLYKGVRAGKFGVGSVFSFHRTKTLTTGEGGMLLLDDDKLFERCKFLRDHGRAPGTWYNTEVTFKYMPFNMQAALGYAQFQRINELVERKRWIWRGYKSRLVDLNGLLWNPEPSGVTNSVWCPAVVFDEGLGITKEDAMRDLGEMGLPSRPFFYPLSSLPAFGSRGEWGQQQNPISYSVSSRAINVPSAFTVDDEQLDRMAGGLRKLISSGS